MKYLCESCSENGVEYISEEILEFIRLFLDYSESNEYETFSDLYINAKSDKLAKAIFEKSLHDSDLLKKMWDISSIIQDNNHICERCGKSIHYYLQRYEINNIYNKLSILQKEYLISILSALTRIDHHMIETVFKDYSYYFDGLLFIERKNSDFALHIRQSDEVIRWFYSCERGGDGELQLFSLISTWVSNTFIPTILYDISIWGLVKVFSSFRKKIIKMRTKKQSYKLLNQTNKEMLDEVLNTSALKNLSKSQQKKILQQIVEYEIDNAMKRLEESVKKK